MAKKNHGIDIDFSVFSDYAEEIENLGGNLKKIFGDAMEDAGRKVQKDTIDALADQYLPAHGKYSTGRTKESVISPEQVRADWQGTLATVHLGFDRTKPGAGNYLITGTPKMKPDYKLEDIYIKKSYSRKIRKKIDDDLKNEIKKLSDGR